MRYFLSTISILLIIICFSSTSCQKFVDNTSAVDSLRISVAQLQKRTDSLSFALASTNLSLSNLARRVDSINSQIIIINTQIIFLNQQLISSNNNIASISAQIAALNQQIANLLAQLNLIIIQLNSIPRNLSNGLLAYYPFNGNARDSSINNNHASISNVILGLDRFNNQNSSYQFNGTTSRITTPVRHNNLTAYAVSFWFKTTIGGYAISGRTDQTGFLAAVHNQQTGGVNVGKLLFVADAPGTSIGTITNNTYLDGKWHHFVGNFTGQTSPINPSEFSIYIDNILVSQTTTNTRGSNPVLPINSNSNILIGDSYTVPGAVFNGSLDEIRIFNRILSIHEINYLFNN